MKTGECLRTAFRRAHIQCSFLTDELSEPGGGTREDGGLWLGRPPAQRLGAALYGREQGPSRPVAHHAETMLRGEGLGELLSPGQCRLQDEAARTQKRGTLSPRGHPAGGPTLTLGFKEKRG